MAADKPYPKQPEGLMLGGSGIPPKFGTFTPPAPYRVFRLIKRGFLWTLTPSRSTKARPG